MNPDEKSLVELISNDMQSFKLAALTIDKAYELAQKKKITPNEYRRVLEKALRIMAGVKTRSDAISELANGSTIKKGQVVSMETSERVAAILKQTGISGIGLPNIVTLFEYGPVGLTIKFANWIKSFFASSLNQKSAALSLYDSVFGQPSLDAEKSESKGFMENASDIAQSGSRTVMWGALAVLGVMFAPEIKLAVSPLFGAFGGRKSRK